MKTVRGRDRDIVIFARLALYMQKGSIDMVGTTNTILLKHFLRMDTNEFEAVSRLYQLEVQYDVDVPYLRSARKRVIDCLKSNNLTYNELIDNMYIVYNDTDNLKCSILQ